jgi:hypothetical protein
MYTKKISTVQPWLEHNCWQQFKSHSTGNADSKTTLWWLLQIMVIALVLLQIMVGEALTEERLLGYPLLTSEGNIHPGLCG